MLNNIFTKINKVCARVANFTFKLLLAVVFDVLIFLSSYSVYWYYFTFDGMKYRVNSIYKNIAKHTGQSTNILPLVIVDSDIQNAYNNGREIVIYTGLIKYMSSMDEVALVLAHEMAHGHLLHLRMLNEWNLRTDLEISYMEANADKLGAIYMMAAGYDICKGRELFKHWKEDNGDYIGENHPTYGYRFDQLNINCD